MDGQHPTTKILIQTVGLISLALGFAGVFLPLLPTTPFILLSAWCFAKSSPRWHAYLNNHREFGPLLTNWNNNRSISLRHKLLASVMICISIATILISNLSPIVKGAVAGILAVILSTLLLVKTAQQKSKSLTD